jgi:N-acyl-D-aspartate/D-glutamate deacylase
MDRPYTLNPNHAFGELVGMDPAARSKAYRDPAWRERAVAGSDAQTTMKPRWGTFIVQVSDAHPETVDRTIEAIAAQRGVHPVLALVDLAVDEPGLNLMVKCVVCNDDPVEVAELLLDEGCTLGLSDAGAHISQLCDAVQPTDLLGEWVRDRGVMSIEAGVRKLTGDHADLLGIPDRGYLRTGYAADVVVFDPATVAPGPIQRWDDFPGNGVHLTAPEPIGVRHVFVNGSAIRTDERQCPEQRAVGQLVRPDRRA